MARLVVDAIHRAKNRLFVLVKLDGMPFSISVWLPGIDFPKLESDLGVGVVKKLLLHSVLFDLQSFMSVAIDSVDITAFGVSVTDDLHSLWYQCAKHGWAEWRYENNLPFQEPPELLAINGMSHYDRASAGSNKNLLMFSGGKDSLACSILLEREKRPYDTFFVLQSKDGRMDMQRSLISEVLRHTRSQYHHESALFEDYIMAPIAECTQYRFKGIATGFAETMSCMFKAVLYAVAFGYRTVLIGNEAASDDVNFVWDATGETINHQWGKSLDAERLVNDYINKNLVDTLTIESLLRGMSDPEIFAIVRENPMALAACHSCNIQKPWCKRCSKCCYIWLSYCAYVSSDFALSVFRDNLFDIASLQDLFRSLYIGPKPFECVGRNSEVVQAFSLCVSNGVSGRAVTEFANWHASCAQRL